MKIIWDYLLIAGCPAFDADGVTGYRVDSNEILTCLQLGINAEHIESIAAYIPQEIVFAESALTDNIAMSNAYYLLDNKDIELTVA